MRIILSILFSFLLSVTAAAGELASIAPADLQARLAHEASDLLVLDVRTAEEYASAHVPGARNIPHDQISSRIEELGDARDREIVVYCRSGRRAALALESLAAAGFERLTHLEGDMLRWQQEGYPTEPAESPAAGPGESESPQSPLQP